MRIPILLKKELEIESMFGFKEIKSELIRLNIPILISERELNLPPVKNSPGIIQIREHMRTFFYVIVIKNLDKCKAFAITRTKKVFPILSLDDGYHFYQVIKSGINKVKEGKHVFKFYFVVEAGIIPYSKEEYNRDKEEFLKKAEQDRETFLSFVNFFRFKSY